MKRLYLDCEFNGFGGELISIALVDASDVAFYGGTTHREPTQEWVKANVLPVLDKSFLPWQPILLDKLAVQLVCWLAAISESSWAEVVADHPADFVHLHALLDIWSGQHDHANLPFQLRTLLVHSGELDSAVPHNALEDAMALARWGEKELGA